MRAEITGEHLLAEGLQRAEPDDVFAREVDLRVSFEEFYLGSRTRLLQGLALALGDVDLAAEAADEALTRAYLRWAKVGLLDNPAGWAFRVGLNWGRSSLRHLRRRQERPLFVEVPAAPPEAPEPLVDAALARLDVDRRAVIVCRIWLGWSEQQTADALGIRVGTVKSRQHRALAELEVRLSSLRRND